MSSLILGLSTVLGIVAFTMGSDYRSYFEPHSIALVLGGTVGVLLLTSPTDALFSLWVSIKGLMRPAEGLDRFQEDIRALSRNRTAPVSSGHPLISYASDLWQQGVESELFQVLLLQKRAEIESQSLAGIQTLKNLTKYPPALGMAGTVMGMVTLFSDIDTNKSNIGSSLSIAMTATFLGLVLANLFVAPLADRVHVRQMSQENLNERLCEILSLINQGEPPSLLEGGSTEDRAYERAA
jgi:chemotaxis protein MotA